MHATFKLLIVSTLYIYSFYDRLIYNVKFLEMVATTILITCLYSVSLCVTCIKHALWLWDGELQSMKTRIIQCCSLFNNVHKLRDQLVGVAR